MNETAYPDHTDRADLARTAIAGFLAAPGTPPADRDLDNREILRDAGSDLLYSLLHALEQADLDVEDETTWALGLWRHDHRTDPQPTAGGSHAVGALIGLPEAEPGAPQPRREAWWEVTGDRSLAPRAWPLAVQRRIVTGLLDAETANMNTLLAQTFGTAATPVRWLPEAAAAITDPANTAALNGSRLAALLHRAHRCARDHYAQIEQHAVAAHLADQDTKAHRKGWRLEFHYDHAEACYGIATRPDPEAPTVTVHTDPGHACTTDGDRIHIDRPLDATDAAMVGALTDTLAALPLATARQRRPSVDATVVPLRPPGTGHGAEQEAQ